MKRYKDITVAFASDEEVQRGLGIIKEKCSSGNFVFDEELEKQYTSDQKILHIIVRLPNSPKALLILRIGDCKLSVINVIPYQGAVEAIGKDEYNHIVDEFYSQVLRSLFKEDCLVITPEEISMKDLIPKTFDYLNNWAHCPGAPNSPFGHQNDLYMWFTFLCELRRNHEELSSGNLEQWLREDILWENDVVEDAIIRYETEIDLLKYYDRYKS